MTAKDLMLGNYVMDRNGKILRIDFFEYLEKGFDCKFGQHNPLSDGFGPLHPFTEYTDYAKPIPLTDEILSKCKFRFAELGFEDLNVSKVLFKSGYYFIIDVYFHEINYLHELQNLYKLLIGKELEIEL